jgi:hypothetical protein
VKNAGLGSKKSSAARAEFRAAIYGLKAVPFRELSLAAACKSPAMRHEALFGWTEVQLSSKAGGRSAPSSTVAAAKAATIGQGGGMTEVVP